MSGEPSVSILINNYNYGHFLADAIDSALEQRYPKLEIIVVDDGSTDSSHAVMQRYGEKIHAIYNPHGGQTAAFNTGYAASQGDLLLFLDSDDRFLPGKVAKIVEWFETKRAEDQRWPEVLLYHRLEIVGRDRVPIGKLIPPKVIRREPNLYDHAVQHRWIPFASAPTSGLAISRTLADKVFPIPLASETRADEFVVKGASLLGEVHGIADPLGQYRAHGANYWYTTKPRPGREFLLQLDTFLNRRLEEHGLRGRLSYYESHKFATEMLEEGERLALAKWMVRNLVRAPFDPDSKQRFASGFRMLRDHFRRRLRRRRKRAGK